ncbi:MAG: RdgB/HAM1 family non-canonical purine NTP pyrophosphatase [Alphaproteobacteria bacterium]
MGLLASDKKPILKASEGFSLSNLILATHNVGKVVEFSNLLQNWHGKVVGAKNAGLGEPVENGGTFEANATLKAEAACATTGCWSLADDSGLCVSALGGTPGVDTAYYGGWEKLLHAMEGVSERSAIFVCVLALARPNLPTQLFQGTVQGHIALEGRGEGGFGFDPVFCPENSTKTYAELGLEAKAATSHRARAFAHLNAWLAEHAPK